MTWIFLSRRGRGRVKRDTMGRHDLHIYGTGNGGASGATRGTSPKDRLSFVRTRDERLSPLPFLLPSCCTINRERKGKRRRRRGKNSRERERESSRREDFTREWIKGNAATLLHPAAFRTLARPFSPSFGPRPPFPILPGIMMI